MSSNRSRQLAMALPLWPLTIICLGLFIILSGCSGINQMAGEPIEAQPDSSSEHNLSRPIIRPFFDVLEASYTAADCLAEDLRRKLIKSDASIITASFVNINNLEESCPLGRVISEQISSRIAQHGLRILELKLRQNSVYIKKGKGEFLLSRKIKEISESYNGDYVMVGTYTMAEKSIYISARIVNTTDNSVTTGCDFQLERNYQIDSLLNGSY
jgi:TolB-like protein